MMASQHQQQQRANLVPAKTNMTLLDMAPFIARSSASSRNSSTEFWAPASVQGSSEHTSLSSFSFHSTSLHSLSSTSSSSVHSRRECLISALTEVLDFLDQDVEEEDDEFFL